MAYITQRDLSSMRGAFRLDAEFWLPEYVRVEKAIASVDHMCLGDLASDVRKGIFYILASEYTASGVPFYRSSNVGEILMKETNLAFITEAKDSKEAKTSLRFGDIVLSKTGREAAAVVTVDRCNISQDVIGIRLSKGAINPFFLVTFLNSEPGILQMRRWFQGQVQMHLTLPDARRVLVPVLPDTFQRRVETSVREALKCRVESADLYALAEELFLSELGLDSLDLSPTLFYERKFSETQQAARVDAEYYQPVYQRVLAALEASKPKRIAPLHEFLALLTNGHTPRHHDLSEGSVPFLTAEHVFNFRIDYDSMKRILSEHHDGELKRTQLKSGDCLLTIKGRIGNAAIAEDLPGPVNINQDVALLRLQHCLPPYYLVAYLNSLAGQAFSQQYSTGQINPFLGLGNVRLLPIPIYDDRTMQRIAAKTEETVLNALAARDESRRLLEAAKRMVEEAVLHRTQ